MNEEWKMIAADEKESLDSQVDHFIDGYLVEFGYKLIGLETHYSIRNMQWETLIKFKGDSRVQVIPVKDGAE